MILRIHTDGGSKGNPGPAAIGVVMYLDGRETYAFRQDIGVATNNDAEYQALVAALTFVADHKDEMSSVQKIECFADSQLMVNQVRGLWKVKEARMREYILRIRNLEGEIGLPIQYEYVPREQNKTADALVNDAHPTTHSLVT